jgi:activator of Hsp90 ATPase-like protein
VLVTVAAGDGGTELTVLHGPHGQGTAEQAARSDHREGWEYFLARLGQLLAPPQSQ